jgi:hypothetical protein
MANYSNLTTLMPLRSADGFDPLVWRRVTVYLVGEWLDDYRGGPMGIVEVNCRNFSYLFDITTERLLAAWGISRGKYREKRDKARMQGHPLSAGSLYHRGHAIAHTLGGATDINLVPQLGKINIGPFRRLEKEAVATPGSLYFTHWRYSSDTFAGGASQTPNGVDQGLLISGQRPKVTTYPN